MAKYRITAPDGNTYEVTAPDDATQDQVLAYAQANYKPAPAPRTPKPADDSIDRMDAAMRDAYAGSGTDQYGNQKVTDLPAVTSRPDFSDVSANVDTTYEDRHPDGRLTEAGWQKRIDASKARDPLAGSGSYPVYLAGVGKWILDTGRGIRQDVVDTANRASAATYNALGGLGMDGAQAAFAENIGAPVAAKSRQLERETASNRAAEAPIMARPAGMAGNVIGTLGQMFLPGVALRGTTIGRMALPTSLTGNAIQGAVVGGIQPVETQQERVLNTVGGGLAGWGGVAAPKAIGAVARPAMRLVGNQSISGAERAAATQIQRNAADPSLLLQAQPSAVPGVQRSLAQETSDPGVAALERMVRGRNAGVFAPVDAQNNAARVQVLERIAGTDADMVAANAARDTASGASRSAAMAASPADISATLATLDAAIDGARGRTTIQPALQGLRDRLASYQDSGGKIDIQTLENVRLDIGDMLAGKFGGDSGSALTGARELIGVRDAFNAEVGAQVPAFTDYLQAFRAASKPINRMEVGRELISKTSAANPADAVGTPLLQAAPFGRAMKDLDAVAVRATGFNKANAEDVLDASDLADLRAIADDMTRIAVAQRPTAIGSPTDANQYLGEQLANEAAREAAKQLPFGLGALTYFQNKAAAQTQEKMAYLLANPAELRRVLAVLPSKDREAVNKVLLQLSARTGASVPALTE